MTEKLKPCTCLEVYGENPDCAQHGDLAYLVHLAMGLAEEGTFFQHLEDPMDWAVRRWEDIGGDPNAEFTAADLTASLIARNTRQPAPDDEEALIHSSMGKDFERKYAPQARPDSAPVGLQYEIPVGSTIGEMRENVRKTDLYQRGDTVLIWVNEGDLILSALRTHDDALEDAVRCPNCHVKFQRVNDVDAHIRSLKGKANG